MNNAVYGKTMENVRNRIDVRYVSNEKDYLEWTSKRSYMSQKILDNNLFPIRKTKVKLTLIKPSHVGLCISDFSKVLMSEFHFDYIKNKYGNKSRLLFTGTDSLVYEIKIIKILVRIKKCLILVILQLIHDETIVVAIKDFVGLKPKMYSFLVDDNSEHDNEKGVNKNVVERLIHSEYKNVLLNRKCLRHLINRFQSKNHRIGTYEINKIYTLNNGYDGLSFGY